MTHCSKNEVWEKLTVTNINIFFITDITRSFTDRIFDVHKSVYKKTLIQPTLCYRGINNPASYLLLRILSLSLPLTL